MGLGLIIQIVMGTSLDVWMYNSREPGRQDGDSGCRTSSSPAASPLSDRGDGCRCRGVAHSNTASVADLPHRIASTNRFLDSYLVEAPAECQPRHSLLIFQGKGGDDFRLGPRTAILDERCISSLVFDYSGNGDSSPMRTIDNLREDAVAAYAWFYARFGASGDVRTFAFSMGTSVLLDAYSDFRPPLGCIILDGASTSARDVAVQTWGIPRWLVKLAPDQWNSLAAISGIHSSLLVVHSDGNRTIPLWMGERLYETAPQPKQLVVLHGLAHSAVSVPVKVLWSPVARFIRVGAAR